VNSKSKPESAERQEGTIALTELIIGATIEVHQHTGPGLMESVCEECTAQLLTYLKLSGKKLGLILNFDSPILTKGIKRLVNHFPEPDTALVPSAPSALSGFDFRDSASQLLCGEETVVK
jgi:PD-(D/E)XK nuclease superfamily